MSRYTSVTETDLREMLDAIGAATMDDLFADIPKALRLQRPIKLPDGRSEQEVYEELAGLAGRKAALY